MFNIYENARIDEIHPEARKTEFEKYIGDKQNMT